jgi:hypothetical protein
MTTTRRKTRRGAVKAFKRPEPRRGRSRRRFITRAEALLLAGRHVLDRMFKGATVRDGEEARINTYNIRHKDTWVVYKNCALTGLRASDVVVVCKRTGRVLYEGSAGDEG